MAELGTLLTENPATFKGGGIWRIMVNINDALTAIAYGLLVLFFAAGIIKTCGSFTDLKKPDVYKRQLYIKWGYCQKDRKGVHTLSERISGNWIRGLNRLSF